MKRPQVFSTDTVLWHPTEGKKLFPAGETDPGPTWHNQEGGDTQTAATSTQALKDMILMQDQIEAKDRILASKDHDLAQMSKARDEAEGVVSGLKQRALDAERLAEEAGKVAAELTAERDRARQLEASLRARIAELEAGVAKFDPDGDGKAGGATPPSPERDAIMAELDGLKVEYDRRLGVARLKALLDAAKAG